MSHASDHPGPNALTSREAASLWAARLEGEDFSAADRRALEAWLAAAPQHRALLSEYCQFSAELEQTLPAVLARGTVTLPPVHAPRRARRSAAWLGLALAAAACVALLFWAGRPRQDVRSIATSVGQRQSLTLDDGTRVELNARTSLLVDQNGRERHVRLAEGEAFFTVAKDKSRPFVVETPNGSVRVTGTVFDVRTESSQSLDVTVVEGSVQVRPGEFGRGLPSAPVSLAAGDQLAAAATGVSVSKLPPEEVGNRLAWRQGQVVFEGVPLREALGRFARYHGRGIVASPEAAGLRVGGRFSLDDLDGFFSALEQVLPVRVTHDLSGTVTVSLRPQA
jgi:transmembrane sensor